MDLKQDMVKGAILRILENLSPHAIKPGLLIQKLKIDENMATGNYLLTGSVNKAVSKRVYISSPEGFRARITKDRLEIRLPRDEQLLMSADITRLRAALFSVLPGEETEQENPFPQPTREVVKPEE
ncbi:MAG: hypothetical protein A2075_03205 [Geobacteraceae bacterium GWC2_58_44]|nr:MAG: hypothetical protein A2075_03205 [Geobacteraceae bacterium GWC2_58_44]HBG05834.1 hypothetical protein [Geobacter sp.]